MNLKIGWLAPNGGLYECNSYDHISTARDLVTQFGYPKIDPIEGYLQPDENLLKHKWVHIGLSSLGRKEWRISWEKFLTEAQKQVLVPYFEESEIPMNYFSQAKWDQEMNNI